MNENIISDTFCYDLFFFFFFSSRRRHTRSLRDWSSDVCSSDLQMPQPGGVKVTPPAVQVPDQTQMIQSDQVSTQPNPLSQILASANLPLENVGDRKSVVRERV